MARVGSAARASRCGEIAHGAPGGGSGATCGSISAGQLPRVSAARFQDLRGLIAWPDLLWGVVDPRNFRRSSPHRQAGGAGYCVSARPRYVCPSGARRCLIYLVSNGKRFGVAIFSSPVLKGSGSASVKSLLRFCASSNNRLERIIMLVPSEIKPYVCQLLSWAVSSKLCMCCMLTRNVRSDCRSSRPFMGSGHCGASVAASFFDPNLNGISSASPDRARWPSARPWSPPPMLAPSAPVEFSKVACWRF